MRTALSSSRTALSSARMVIRNFSNVLAYPGTAGNYADFGSATLFDSTLPFAVEMWINCESYFDAKTTVVHGILNIKTDQGVPFVFFLQGSAGVIFKCGASSIFPTFAATGSNSDIIKDIISKGWNQIVMVYNGADRTAASSYTFYFNGTAKTMGTTSVPSATSHLNTAGRLGATFPGRFNICSLRIWNGGSTMTANQVMALYRDNVLPTGPTLIRNFPHTNGSGTTITETVSGQNGTITGTVPWNTSGPLRTRDKISTARGLTI